MPVERRIREGAHRNAGVLDPDVDRFLGSVVRRTRRRTVVRRSLTAAVAIPTVVMAIALGPHVLDAVRGSERPVPGTQPPPSVGPSVNPVAPPFTGTFTRTLDGALAVVRANGISGTWTISVDARGRLRLLPPPSFVGTSASRPFEVLGASVLRIDAFRRDICAGTTPGTYSWSRAGRVLQLTTVHDPCDARAAILSSGPWRGQA